VKYECSPYRLNALNNRVKEEKAFNKEQNAYDKIVKNSQAT
jgi:hypothetical protein